MSRRSVSVATAHLVLHHGRAFNLVFGCVFDQMVQSRLVVCEQDIDRLADEFIE